MTTVSNHVGIQSLGHYLPSHIRTNDWWPEKVVAQWRERSKRMFGRLDVSFPNEGFKKVVEAMANESNFFRPGWRESNEYSLHPLMQQLPILFSMFVDAEVRQSSQY